MPYERDERLSRPWAIPGTAGLEHRIGGLEKANITGNVSYDPVNHENMCHLRAQKVANIADDIPLQELDGAETGDLLVLSWGGPYGACATAVHTAQKGGQEGDPLPSAIHQPVPQESGKDPAELQTRF